MLGLKLELRVCLSVYRVFERKELWINVQVANFFATVNSQDSISLMKHDFHCLNTRKKQRQEITLGLLTRYKTLTWEIMTETGN